MAEGEGLADSGGKGGGGFFDGALPFLLKEKQCLRDFPLCLCLRFTRFTPLVAVPAAHRACVPGHWERCPSVAAGMTGGIAGVSEIMAPPKRGWPRDAGRSRCGSPTAASWHSTSAGPPPPSGAARRGAAWQQVPVTRRPRPLPQYSAGGLSIRGGGATSQGIRSLPLNSPKLRGSLCLATVTELLRKHCFVSRSVCAP